MNKWDKFWNWFIHSRTDGAMIARTIGEGIVSIIIANIDLICGMFSFPPALKALFIVGLPALFSSILSYVRQASEKDVTVE